MSNQAKVSVLVALVVFASGCRTSFLAKPSPDAIRVVTWNIGRDSMFAGTKFARAEQFARVMRAVQPDIVCLQEVWAGTDRAAAVFDAILPIGNGRAWQHHGVIDSVILSRFDLTRRDAATLPLTQRRIPGHAMALAGDVYVICGHFQSGMAIVQRQEQADLVLQHIGGLPDRTPIVILGDLNANSSSPPAFIADLRSGRTHGKAPDWDGSALEDALPRHNGRGEDVWTWNKEGGEFPPSTMDRVLYTGSVLVAEHSFVLNTTTMTAEELRASGLERDDVMFQAKERFHDHLPVVVDFRLRR